MTVLIELKQSTDPWVRVEDAKVSEDGIVGRRAHRLCSGASILNASYPWVFISRAWTLADIARPETADVSE